MATVTSFTLETILQGCHLISLGHQSDTGHTPA
jgi:hypothetical protein